MNGSDVFWGIFCLGSHHENIIGAHYLPAILAWPKAAARNYLSSNYRRQNPQETPFALKKLPLLGKVASQPPAKL
jgi:hypothetical protein